MHSRLDDDKTLPSARPNRPSFWALSRKDAAYDNLLDGDKPYEKLHQSHALYKYWFDNPIARPHRVNHPQMRLAVMEAEARNNYVAYQRPIPVDFHHLNILAQEVEEKKKRSVGGSEVGEVSTATASPLAELSATFVNLVLRDTGANTEVLTNNGRREEGNIVAVAPLSSGALAHENYLTVLTENTISKAVKDGVFRVANGPVLAYYVASEHTHDLLYSREHGLGYIESRGPRVTGPPKMTLVDTDGIRVCSPNLWDGIFRKMLCS